MKTKLGQRVRVVAHQNKRLHNRVGSVKSRRQGYDKEWYASVEFEVGKTFDVLEDELRIADVRFEKGARVKVIYGQHKGALGTVGGSFSKHGQPRCWVALDVHKGGETGFARVDLERVKVAKGQVSLPDPEGKNVARSRRASKTLKFYYSLSGAGGLNVPTGETGADLLCDLAHWADRNGEDFGAMLLSASSNYSAETGGRGLQMSKFIMC